MKAPDVCEGCGACCWEQQVELTDEDCGRVPAALWHYEPDCTNPRRLVPAMRQNRGTRRCVALGVDFRCEIYDLRPTPCRTFQHRSWGCRKCVEQHGPRTQPDLIQVLHLVRTARVRPGSKEQTTARVPPSDTPTRTSRRRRRRSR